MRTCFTLCVISFASISRAGSEKHGVVLGGFSFDPATGRVVVVSVIDNLLKGAATQAVQNLNLAFGFDEFAGIPLSSTGSAATNS